MANEDLARGVLNISHKLEKVYEAAARTLNENRPYMDKSLFGELMMEMADRFAAIDSSFDRVGFYNIADPD